MSSKSPNSNTMHKLYKKEPVKRIGQIDIFIETDELDRFKQTEAAFWDLQYEDRDIDEVDRVRDLSFHQHYKQPLESLPDGAKILEIGCGSRGDMLELAGMGKHVIQSDISLEAVKKTLERAQKIGVHKNCSYLVCDAEDIPYVDKALDAVFIAAALHHLPHPKEGLYEFARVLKPGGLLVIGVEPNTWPYYTIFLLLSPLKKFIRKRRGRKLDSIADDTTHGFSYFALKKMVQEVDLELLDIRPVKFFLELYDSGVPMFNKLLHREWKANLRARRFILSIDDVIGKIPLINWFPWHWNVITRKKT